MSRESIGLRSIVFYAVAASAILGGQAEATLIGQNVTIEFLEGADNFTDVVTVGAGSEISFGDGTNIGDAILLDFESIDIGAASISYDIQGGGPPHSTPGFSTTGFGPDARFVFSNLTLPSPSQISAVNIVLSNVIGVLLGTEVSFTDDSVTLFVGTLGIGEVGGPDLGNIRLDLTFTPINGPVPEPSLAVLIGIAVAAAAVRRYGRRHP